MKLNALKLGLAAGIFWGLSLFVLTFANLWFDDYAGEWLRLMGNTYPGYELSPVGSIVGLIYGFFVGFISIGIFAWIYNKLVGC